MKPKFADDKSDVGIAYAMAFEAALYHRHDEEETRKGGFVKSPNSYVFFAARRLDADYGVRSFRHGRVRYEYFHPERRRVEGAYLDFDVTRADGSRQFVFVTAQKFLSTPVEEAMIEGAESAARDVGAGFEVWTEVELFGPNPAYMKSVIPYIMDKLWMAREKEQDNETEDFGAGDEDYRRGAHYPRPKWPGLARVP